ncbi:hypothetical protein [Gordonia sp. CPCC 205333]|uniref:hypothetical protein n=1 Tax=Gordonia sp. CPCC 205333 TaxID=3140790 RepID=UPI003AF33FC4
MISAIMAAIGAAMIVLAIVAARCRDTAPVASGLTVVVSLGLAYDNVVVAIGPLIDYGDVLSAINVPRFWLHVFTLPLLIIVGGLLVARLGVGWLTTRAAIVVDSVMVASLVVIGVIGELTPLDLVESDAGGATRYVNDAMYGPPIPAIVTIIVLIGLGALAWRAAGWPWLLVGALVMFAAAAVPGVLWISNAGELVLQTTIVATLVSVTHWARAEMSLIGVEV